MGEILLVCSVITLILLVLFIHKKKEQERQYINSRNKRIIEDSNRRRYSLYSRDDSTMNKISPFRSNGDSTVKYDQNIRHRHMTWVSPRKDNKYYDRFNYSNRRCDGEYANYTKYCNCDLSNCRCNRGYCTPSNYDRDDRNINGFKIEGKDSYYNNDIKSEYIGKNMLEKDNEEFSVNRSNMNLNANVPMYNNNSQIIYNQNLLMNGKSINNNFDYPPNGSYSTNSFNNQNIINNNNKNNTPGYRIIKLEDFLEKEKRDCSPIYRKKNEITLDEVHHSLIKFIKNEDDRKFSENLKLNYEPNSKNMNITRIQKESDNINCDESFLNELIPKKIDFSLLNDTEPTHKKSHQEENKLSTPLAKNDKEGFESFGEKKDASFKSLKSN